MKVESNTITDEQKAKFSDLLSSSPNYQFTDLVKILSYKIASHIESRDHLLGIYSFRMKWAQRVGLKSQLSQFVNNLNSSSEKRIQIIIVGDENDRLIVFTDKNLGEIFGIISKEESESVIHLY